MSDEAHWMLACKVWELKASPRELAQLESWVQQEGNAEKLARYRQLWEMTTPGPAPVFNASESWNELESRLAPPVEKKTIRLFPLLAKIAASLLLLIAAWFYLPGLFASEMVSIRTQAGEQKLVVLPDSSKVWLNASSVIRYPKAFAASRREVVLEGEAFFDITKNASKPFIIESKETETTVLGTSFSIKAVADLPVTVTVVTGKVQFGPIADRKQRVVLLPGDAGIFDSQQDKLLSHVNEDPRFMEWHNHTLSFHKTPLARVFETLEDVYNIQIGTMSAVSPDCVFTGEFENATAKEILEVLGGTVGLEWSGNDGQYKINHISCQ